MRVGLQRDDRIHERDAHDLEAPMQERQQRDLRLDTLRADHRGSLRPRRVAERHVIGAQRRLERQIERERSADGERPARGGRDARSERLRERIDVDGRDGDGDRDEHQGDHAAGDAQDDENGAPHRAAGAQQISGGCR